MPRINQEALRELDVRELAVCRAGEVLDALEVSDAMVSADEYAKALRQWKQEIGTLMTVRDTILSSLDPKPST